MIMYNIFRKEVKNLLQNRKNILNTARTISNAEIAAALRPFYFVVHPDLFGRYPEQRQTNEDSLKHLSIFLESLQNQRIPNTTPQNLPFYVRSSENDTKRSFQLIKVPLLRNLDAKAVLKRILEACHLPTDYIDKVKSVDKNKSEDRIKVDSSGFTKSSFEEEELFDDSIIFGKIRTTREEHRLQSWIEANIGLAEERSQALQELKDEVIKLKEAIVVRLKLKELQYECGWNIEHYRGCLKSLDALANLYWDDMKSLKDRIVVFAPLTGVSLEGNVMLFTGDVQRNWLDLLRNLPKHDSHLKKIPAYEYALSQVLRNIRISRRKFMPKTHASEYTLHLRKIMTTLLDYLGKHSYPKSWPESLENFEIVIESEAGPLMVSPTGQIIAPSTCPGFLLVDFITSHMKEAEVNADNYKKNKYIEKSLHQQTIADLNLYSLKKDDSVTPERMIKCCERLLQSQNILKFGHVDLHITHYYSVLSDGTVCIPWDWKM